MTRRDGSPVLPLAAKTLEQALPQLLKTLERGWRAVVIADKSTRRGVDGLLWTYAREGFTAWYKDGYTERQPVWLTDSDENPNNAVFIPRRRGRSAASASSTFAAEVFDGRDDRQSRAPAITGRFAKSLGMI